MRNKHSYERTVYVSPKTKPGDSLSYGDWRDEPGPQRWYDGPDDPVHRWRTSYTAHGVPLTIIEYATGSDYSGTLVEVSNARCLKREFPWLIELHGGHGTFGVAYLGKRENQNPALIEAIDSLARYPLYSDDDHSELEHEAADEAWEEDGRDDFKRALVKYFDEQYAPDEHCLDEIADERIDNLWCDCTERLRGGESHINEQGDSIYFPISDVIRKIERCWPGLNKPHYYGERPSINVQLSAIASDATVASDESEASDAGF